MQPVAKNGTIHHGIARLTCQQLSHRRPLPRRTAARTSRHVCSVASPVSPAVAAPRTDKHSGSREGASLSSAQPKPSQGQSKEQHQYQWTKQWYPVAVESALDPTVPHKVTLMGHDLVLWKQPGDSGTWSCFDNACPHRAAPLSQGRVDATTGCLQCSYHGWEFNAEGKCTDIPQSSSPGSMCSLKATRARGHPVQLRQGLLWVWPEAGPDAATEAAATPAVVAPQLDDPSWVSDFGWIWREVQVSFDYAVENSLDIAHAPFAHHGCLGVSMESARSDAALTVTRNEPQWGVELVNDPPATDGLLASFRQTHTYQAPGLFHVLNDQGKGPMAGMEIKLVVYRTPVKAGSCYVFYNNITRGAPPAMKAKLSANKKPPLETHLSMLRFFDADLIIMHEQERLVQQKGGWRSAYCMPHHTDGGVLALRRWLDAAGPVPYKDGQALGPILPRQRVLEHYESHVLKCPDCQKGLAKLRQKQTAALVGSIILAATSLAVAAAQAARMFIYNTPGTGVAAKAAVLVASSGSFTERLASTLSAAATGSGALWWLLPLSGVAMAVGAVWLYFRVYKGLKQWEQDNVFYRDYDLRYGPDHRPALSA